MKINVLSNGQISFPEPKYRYGIFKHRAEGRTGAGAFKPDTTHLQNGRPPFTGTPAANDDGKGNQILVEKNIWSYLEKINSKKAYEDYVRAKSAMWCNDKDWNNEIPYSSTLAECIGNGGNFYISDLETPTHLRLVSFPRDMDTSTLDPAKNNWFEQSEMFWKACAIDENGWVTNVGSNLDVYFMRIAYEPLWVNKKEIEIFPVGPNYKFKGCNVYDGNQPLMTYNGRERTFHTSWKISTFGVIPPN